MNWLQLGPCRLICADCLDVIPSLVGVDAVVTDPPFNVDFQGKQTKERRGVFGGYNEGDSDVGPDAVRLALQIAERGIVFPGNRMMFEYPKPYEIGCVYCPSGAGLGRWGFTVMHPMLFYGVALPHGRQGPAGFESFDTAESNGHPCPKPERWMRWAVEKCTLPGQTVLDCFLGSGTTAISCIRAGRQFIGIEKDTEYFHIAVDRIQRELAQPMLLPVAQVRHEQPALIA